MLYLRHTNYYVNKNNQLCNNVPDFSFIFFTSSECSYCYDLMPDFIRLSKAIQGCTFGQLDVDYDNQAIRVVASRSSTPINYVPYLVLYVNGIPFNVYTHDERRGSNNFEGMKQFLIHNTQRLLKNPNQPPPPTGPINKGAVTSSQKIPGYSIGKPVCKNGLCYYSYDAAYSKK